MNENVQNNDAYDFCLSDELNEKLRAAVTLLDEVLLTLAQEREEFAQDFVHELNQGTKRIANAISRLEQDHTITPSQQETGNMKTTSNHLLKILRFNGKRWNDYDDIQQILDKAEGEPVARKTVVEMVDELLASGMLGQRVHPTYKHQQFIVA